MTEVTEVQDHDCPVLGKNTRLVNAYLRRGDKFIGQQYKCPLCGYARGELELLEEDK